MMSAFWAASRGVLAEAPPEHGEGLEVVAGCGEAGAEEVSGHAVARGVEAGEDMVGLGLDIVDERVVEGWEKKWKA